MRRWDPKPNSKDKIAILIFHGITAYAGPYKDLANSITKEGFTVFGLDLRGHGLSDGIRGDYPNKARVTKDLCETLTFIREKYSKLIILGHSLGVYSSAIALSNCLENINGAVLLSASRTLGPNTYTEISFLAKLKIFFYSILFPSKPIIKYEREGLIGRDDPLFNFNYTFRFLRIFDPKKFTLPKNLDIPVFVGVGDQDELFSVESVKELYEEIPSTKKVFYVAKGAKHATFPEGSMSQLLQWLNETF